MSLGRLPWCHVPEFNDSQHLIWRILHPEQLHPVPEWLPVSVSDFLNGCLARNVSARLPATQVLAHKFLSAVLEDPFVRSPITDAPPSTGDMSCRSATVNIILHSQIDLERTWQAINGTQ